MFIEDVMWFFDNVLEDFIWWVLDIMNVVCYFVMWEWFVGLGLMGFYFFL